MSWLTREEIERWNHGAFTDSYRKMGAHPDGDGTWFAVWAPHADSVSVLGEFNHWSAEANRMERLDGGVWQTHVPGARARHRYKFRIQRGYYAVDKSDPYAFAMEPPASTGSASAGLASIITELDYTWNDQAWQQRHKGPGTLGEPVAIYEVHLGSWRHKLQGQSLSYREIAEPLADHVEKLGFTHVELMPLMEHPYYGSWGYQVVGYYAPTFRFGAPEDLMYLIDHLHQRGIGVLMDWVPAHFATDPQGLVFYDGSTLFEYEDPRMRYHPDWGTFVFDYHKPGVKSFLVSNALFWLQRYHVDGLRFDAVASMLYRDYSRNEWTPNMFGGRENLEAIDILKQINETVYSQVPEALMVAEESTAWPNVSKPTYDQGLGFLYKWNMGWMHDTLEYMRLDPIHRKYHHDDLTFPFVYCFSEHYVLPLSHDEVVHGKGSLWGKMPGDPWQKAANLRLLYGHMIGSPGKKLLFMGSEFGQESEWSHDHLLAWDLLEDPLHLGIMRWLQDLLSLYRTDDALWNDMPGSFEGIAFDDRDQSVLAYQRHNPGHIPGQKAKATSGKQLVFALNFTPVPRHNYRIGVPEEGMWRERLNSDAHFYGGSGVGNYGHVETSPVPYHGRPASLVLTLPPLGMLVLERADEAGKAGEAGEDGAKE